MIQFPDHRLRGGIEVSYGRTFTQKFGVIAHSKVNARLFSGALLEDRDNCLMHCAGQDSAADSDGVAIPLILERFPNHLAHTSNEGQVKIAVSLTWCTDADEGEFRVADGFI